VFLEHLTESAPRTSASGSFVFRPGCRTAPLRSRLCSDAYRGALMQPEVHSGVHYNELKCGGRSQPSRSGPHVVGHLGAAARALRAAMQPEAHSGVHYNELKCGGRSQPSRSGPHVVGHLGAAARALRAARYARRDSAVWPWAAATQRIGGSSTRIENPPKSCDSVSSLRRLSRCCGDAPRRARRRRPAAAPHPWWARARAPRRSLRRPSGRPSSRRSYCGTR
jgi:hypothetical protein